MMTSYTGIDLSKDALKHAKEKLSKLECDIELVHGDILEVVEESNKTFDVIVAGYSLHHFKLPEKARIFKACKRLLASQGKLLYYDELSLVGESEKAFIERLWKVSKKSWTKRSQDEYFMLERHIFTQDHPLSKDALERLVTQAGFKNSEHLYQDDEALFSFIQLT